MSIKTYRPTTPARRHMTVSGFDGVDKRAKPEKSLVEVLKRHAGRWFVDPFFPKAQDRHLLEFPELPVGKAPNGEVCKVLAKDTADIRRQTVVGNDIDQKPAKHEMAHALHQKPLFMTRPAAALGQHR